MKTKKLEVKYFNAILLVTLFLIFIINFSFGQSPAKMSYQAVIRDAANKLVINQQVGIQIKILQGSVDGTSVYTETQKPTTNANGLVSIEIGGGAGFDAIDWNNGPFFIETNTDPKGGANYTITGTSQLLGVPFAYHATKAESLVHPIVEKDPAFTSWDKSSGIKITESQVTNLKHFTNDDEIDPKFGASVAKGITQADTAKWNKKLENIMETDPKFTVWDKSSGISIKENQISDLKHFTSADETDPKFGVSVAKGITKADTTKWNHKSNFSGSYPDLTNKPTGLSAFANDAGYQKIIDDEDTDPENELQWIYRTTDHKIGITDGGWVYIPDVEADPIFGASVAKGITRRDTANWNNILDAHTETDPVFGSSPAKNITNSGSGAVITTAERTKLNSIEPGSEVNVQADWTQTTTSADNYIQHKPVNVSAFTNDAGYITSEVDGSVTNELQALKISHDTIYLSNGGFVKLPAEADPIYNASQAKNITATDITHLSNLSGTNTGDQNLSGLATKTALGDSTASLRSEIPDVSGFILTETDPIYTGDSLFIKTGVRSWNSSLAKTIDIADTTRWGLDNDSTNELQAISISNDTLYLTNGGFVKLTPVTAVNFSGNLAGDVIGTQSATHISRIDGYSASYISYGASLAWGATNSNGDAIVKRDGSGNFAAGTITADVNGNATTATTAGALSAQYIDWNATAGGNSIANKPAPVYGYCYHTATFGVNDTIHGGDDFLLSDNGSMSGISHTPGSSDIKVNSTGMFKIDYSINSMVCADTFAIAVNGVVVPSTISMIYSLFPGCVSGTVILPLNTADVISITNESISPLVLLSSPIVGVKVAILKID